MPRATDKSKKGFATLESKLLVKAPWNYKRDDDFKLKKLVANFQKNGQLENIIVRVVAGGKYEIVNGNHRMDVFEKLGYKKIAVFNLGNISLSAAKRIAIETNETRFPNDSESLLGLIAEIKAEIPIEELLKTFPFHERELLADLEIMALKEVHKTPGKQKQQHLEPIKDKEVVAKIKAAKNIYFSLSGGRDSTLAVVKILPLLTKNQKVLGLHVETGAELPCILPYVLNFCRTYKIPLKVLNPAPGALEWYFKRQEFPDVIFRECLHKFINDPLNTFLKQDLAGSDSFLLIRGGRKNQKTSVSKSSTYQEVKKAAFTVRLLNPLFALPEKEYEFAIAKIDIWPGYAKGFQRTACWFCPFQQAAQWEALKKEYFPLWQNMLEFSKTWKFKYRKGDSILKRFYKYWENQN